MSRHAPAENPILAFAREEAGGFKVAFHIEPGDGDGYTVAREGEGYLVTGRNPRSCLYGLYHVQQERPAGAFRPAFAVRGVNPCESLACHTPAELRALIDRIGRWRMNTLVVHVNYGWRRHRDLIIEECARRGIDLVFYVYATMSFLPPEAPARWLAKDENETPLTPRPECESRVCLAEPEALAAFTDGARRFFATQCAPAASVLAQTGDGYGHCRCPRCAAMTPVEQWQPLLERFIDAGREVAPGKLLETILYVQRYKLPADLAQHRRLDRLFFDLHQRIRWRPLGNTHPAGMINHREADVDPDARGIPINQYLLDRLADWRRAFPGALYAFENLQLHATLSCPQPNTGVLLEDIRRLREMGVNGAVYEVLNGMSSFVEQMGVLAAALWDPDRPWTPTPLEAWCREHCPPSAHFFLRRYGFPFDEFQDAFDPPLRAHIDNLRAFFAAPTAPNLKKTLEHVYACGDRFARHDIAFKLIRMLHERRPLVANTDAEERFLEIAKLWDFMEPLDDPIAETDALVRGFMAQLAGRSR